MASPTITAEDLRDKYPFFINDNILPSQLAYPIVAAKSRLLKWVGLTNFKDETLADEMKFAWGNLAMHFLIVGLNTHIRNEGIVIVEKAEGDTVNTFLSPDKTQELKRYFLEEAREIIQDYLLVSDEADVGIFFPS
jgi:hypothetical protein